MRQQFEENGFVIVRGLLSPDELAGLQAETDEAIACRAEPVVFEEDSAEASAAVPDTYKDNQGRVFRRLNRVIDRGGAFEHVVFGPLARAVSQIINGSFSVCLNRHNMLMLKAPFNPAPVLWHQDAAVWDEGTFDHVPAIVALDDFLPENGCLEVVPGSHKLGPLGHGWQENTTLIADKYADEIATKAVKVDLRAGDAVLFHGLLLHGSPGNRSAGTRRSLTVAFFPGDLRAVSTQQDDKAPEVRALA